jgi:hypothetical protein
MMRFHKVLIGLTIAAFSVASCGSSNTSKSKDRSANEVVAKANEEGEAYMASIDLNDSLSTANSLYYSRGEGENVEWTEVVMFLNDQSQVVKIIERIAKPGSSAVYSNHFYFKEGKKYTTKQFFEETAGDSTYFVELLSYYDAAEKVKATKRRTAVYEDFLEQVPYMVAEKVDCSVDRALSIINQTGEFETTYQGFVDIDGFKFLIVGENSKEGFSSAIIVQQLSPLILELRAKERQMIGTPLRVEFQTIQEGGGTEQILLSVSKK